jgi:hypothetical protein
MVKVHHTGMIISFPLGKPVFSSSMMAGIGTALSYSNTRGDDERTAGSFEYGSDGFDSAFVELAAFRKSRPIVPEGGVNDGIGCGSSAAQAFQIF